MSEHNPLEGISTPDPLPGEIIVWQCDPTRPKYGHVLVLTAREARAYRRAGRRLLLARLWSRITRHRHR